MRKAIYTLHIGSDQHANLGLCMQTQARYAKRVGADYILHARQPYPDLWVYQNKFYIHELLEEYDRVLWLDRDIMVRDSAPDLFEMVPPDKLGGTRTLLEPSLLRVWLKAISERYGQDYQWEQDEQGVPIYFNCGLMMTSRAHREMFKELLDWDIQGIWPPEQAAYNAYISENQVPMMSLGPEIHNEWIYSLEEAAKTQFVHLMLSFKEEAYVVDIYRELCSGALFQPPGDPGSCGSVRWWPYP
jgi:hypothetical protein